MVGQTIDYYVLSQNVQQLLHLEGWGYKIPHTSHSFSQHHLVATTMPPTIIHLIRHAKVRAIPFPFAVCLPIYRIRVGVFLLRIRPLWTKGGWMRVIFYWIHSQKSYNGNLLFTYDAGYRNNTFNLCISTGHYLTSSHYTRTTLVLNSADKAALAERQALDPYPHGVTRKAWTENPASFIKPEDRFV